MKSFTFRAISIFFASAMLLCLMTGCGSKDPVSTVDFEYLATQKGYIVEDATDLFAPYDYINFATLAAAQDKSFQIEFYELTDEAFASSFYSSNKNNLLMMKSADAIESNDSGSNYDVFRLESASGFMMIERVKNTVVYVDRTDISNKAQIEGFLKELKYL